MCGWVGGWYNVCVCVCDATQVGVGADEEALHETLSVKVLNEMLTNPKGNETKVSTGMCTL